MARAPCAGCGRGRNRSTSSVRPTLCSRCIKKGVVLPEEQPPFSVVCPHCEGGRLKGFCCVCKGARCVDFSTEILASVWARTDCKCNVCQHLRAVEVRIFEPARVGAA